MITQNKNVIGLARTGAILLLLPVIAVLFTDEVKWNSFDFVVAGFLLFDTGLLGELVIRLVKKPNYRVMLCALLLATLLLTWAELAIGIFGTPFSRQ